ncbi:hypothetical protein CONCODRAFT_80103 [Conidiobolus coronatus NRRL 28638]|uniref:Trafficking protein particle complex subunit n=1 Tax=Conidiobolus coronatus (strain ATCC 28846 / CBS 209.66 / NRRL 28638) TaxID=796925 RepID=A0A137NXP6_CONC2|nr:hypothetical protein CONCODRAFT_80103 [Conidiobolus coronatus NRRL 28638]|eukprot:KXN67527.1 hypothetical protein CONCODRAFT_80103 [Conidiobolus coronatus NRRL 28638]
MYKLHYFETLSGIRLVMCTDPGVNSMKDALKYIYQHFFVEFVIKNPLAKNHEEPNKWKVNNPSFNHNLFQYIVHLPSFDS